MDSFSKNRDVFLLELADIFQAIQGVSGKTAYGFSDNLIEKFCLIFRNGLFPDKSIFVRNGFYFRSINKDAFPGNFSKRM